MAELTVQSVSSSGLGPTFSAAAAGGDSFDNSGANAARTFLVVKNGSAGSINVTINSQVPCNQGFDHDDTVSVPAGAERWIGTFNPSRWNDPNGKVQVTYSAVTSVTVAAVRA